MGNRREDLFIQTKYTAKGGQDADSIPYNPRAPLPEQVRASVQESLRNLRMDYIDSLLLHSPMPTMEESLEVYRTLEGFVRDGVIGKLGVSNWYDLRTFRQFYDEVTIKPSFVQNRFVKDFGHDVELRKFLRSLDPPVEYQGFWTLTGNIAVVQKSVVRSIAKSNHMTPEVLWYRFLVQEGIIVLNGTQNHMTEDLAVLKAPQLSAQDMRDLRRELYGQAHDEM
eukprot:GEMP01040480.1.p1 GENE.GEMP01040480.1~~GEMP01040480.1.p1  ORF type:complete len:224 (+),score=45.47 GEMP01040480.1:271-942(+)